MAFPDADYYENELRTERERLSAALERERQLSLKLESETRRADMNAKMRHEAIDLSEVVRKRVEAAELQVGELTGGLGRAVRIIEGKVLSLQDRATKVDQSGGDSGIFRVQIDQLEDVKEVLERITEKRTHDGGLSPHGLTGT